MPAVSKSGIVSQGPSAMANNSASELNGSTVAARKQARKSAGNPASAHPLKSSIWREDANFGTGSASAPSKHTTMRTITLLLSALLIAPFATAQQNGYEGNLGGTIGLSIPMGEFADTWGKEMFTFGGHLTFPSRRIPLQFGAAFGYGEMGKDVSTVPVMDPNLLATEGRLAVKAKVFSYHALLRLSPSKGKVRPYVEGLGGLRQFTTQSKLTVDGLDQALRKERNANNFVMSTGVAAGLMVTLGGAGYIEARVERLYSGKTTYVDPSSIEVGPDGDIAFSTLSSATGAMNILLGVGFRF